MVLVWFGLRFKSLGFVAQAPVGDGLGWPIAIGLPHQAEGQGHVVGDAGVQAGIERLLAVAHSHGLLCERQRSAGQVQLVVLAEGG